MADNIPTKASTGKPKPAGAIWIGATSATLPTDAKTAVGAAFTNLGSVSDEGVKNNTSRKVGSIKDWSGAEVLAPQEEFEDNFTLTLIDAKDINVLKAVYGDGNVKGSYEAGISVQVSPEELEYRAWIIDMILSDGDLKRIVIPKGKITEIGEISYNGTDAVGYAITIKAAPDATGFTHHEYLIKKPTTT